MSSRAIALLVAGGRGTRFGGSGAGEPKQFALLGGRPLIAHAASVLDACAAIDSWIAVAPAGLERETRECLESAGCARRLADVVTGGETRQESVWNGLQAAGDLEMIAVHDAARPFVTAALLAAALAAARRTGAATVAIPVSDTVVRADADTVTAHVDRAGLWGVQTPQVFKAGVLREAHVRAQADGVNSATDDTALVLARGGQVALVPGAWWNFKVTTQEDLHRAEITLAWLAQGAARG